MIKTKVLIVGSGPAGLTAAIYAARAALDPILIHGMQPGGQLTITTDVENYPGFAKPIQGPWLMQEMEAQAEHVGAKLVHDYVEKVELDKTPFKAFTSSGDIYEADSIIICTGAEAKWLGLKSEQEYQGFGVSGCATCDGFFFKNKVVGVIGGGNTAVTEALYLTNHAKKVYLIHRRDALRCEKILEDQLKRNPKIEVLWNQNIQEICGEKDEIGRFVTGIKLENNVTKVSNITSLDGIFIAIGHKPNTDIFKGQVSIDEDGYIITKAGTPITNIDGIFAAGDVQDKVYKQAITSAGIGCAAALEAESFLRSIQKS